MHLSRIDIENFRSYKKSAFEFQSLANLITGPNGSGKTNLLEAVYFLSTGRSFTSHFLPQLLSWQENLSTIRGRLVKKNESFSLETQLLRSGNASPSLTRRFLINRVLKTRKAYLGLFSTVVFNPDDIRLVTGSPFRRRDYLDSLFSLIDWRYSRALNQYQKALKHRNELLVLIGLKRSRPSELFFWDQSLIKNAEIIHRRRQEFFVQANSFFAAHSAAEINQLYLNYHPSPLSENHLKNDYHRDLRLGHTQSGIHRDDFSFDASIFRLPDRDLAHWGSRAQQRMAVLGLKLAEINYIHHSLDSQPVLLLDDIFSELDDSHRRLVTGLSLNYQTLFTSAEPENAAYLPQAKIISL